MLNTVLPNNAAAFFVPAERLPEKVGGVHVFRPLPPPPRDANAQRQFDKSENARYVWVHKGSQVREGRGYGISAATLAASVPHERVQER